MDNFYDNFFNEIIENKKLFLKEKKDFYIFDYVSKDENNLSHILGDILKDECNYKKFTDLIGISKNNGKVTVTKEAYTSKGRRMDILLKDNENIICIENKPYAYDQEEQISHYWDEISKKTNKNPYIVYLTKDGREPSEYSLSKDKKMEIGEKLILMTFAELEGKSIPSIEKWIKHIIESIEKNTNKYFFLEDFKNFIINLKGNVMNEDAEALKKFLKKVKDTSDSKFVNIYKASLKIKNNLDDLHKENLKSFFEKIETGLKENYKKGDWDMEYLNFEPRYSGFKVFKKNWKEVGICYKIENEASFGNFLFYGIYNEYKKDIKIEVENLDTTSFPTWLGWKYFDFNGNKKFETWEENFRIDIFYEDRRNEIAEKVVKEFSEFIDKTINDLDRI
ncbi:hypothetical protein CRU88_10785 [Arcobacter sp. CECT 9188]|nr:hypothetical protein CRU88_10785 [Arcobacter sp. CECT 9188]